MDDTVVLGSHVKMADAEFCTVGLQCLHLLASHGIVNAFLLVAGGVMVWHGHHLLGTEHPNLLVAQCVKRLWRCHLMTIKAVNIELRWAVRHILHHMGIPDFVEEGCGPSPLPLPGEGSRYLVTAHNFLFLL